MTDTSRRGVAINAGTRRVIDAAMRLRDRHHRQRTGTALIEGVRFCLAAERAGLTFERVVVSRTLLRSRPGRDLVRRLAADDVTLARVTPEAFRRLSGAKRASGLAAIVRQRWHTLDELAAARGCWLGLRRIDAPGNLGTIARSAATMGASGIILFGNAIAPYDPAVVRASMGTLFQLRLVRTTHTALSRFVHNHADADWQIVGASARGDINLCDPRDRRRIDFTRPTVLLIGNERKGMTDEEWRTCTRTVRIPMPTDACLNAAVAASLLLYESYRQRMTAATA